MRVTPAPEDVFTWDVWTDWVGHASWTLGHASERVVETLQLISTAFPGSLDSFTVGRNSKVEWTVDKPGLAERFARGMADQWAGGDSFVDRTLHIYSRQTRGVTVWLHQPGGELDNSVGRLKLEFYPASWDRLVEDPPTVAGVTARLGALWEARNSWVDFVHVRQEWNQWKSSCPVYGWATWLHPRFATVDTAGLDVDVTGTEDSGSLIVLQVDPVAMADDDQIVGKQTIQELARRTVLADGRRVIDVNERLRDSLTAG
jgi:hypothetical protein